jgi:hypothetical protein
VTALSMSERWDLQLAKSKDSCHLNGKFWNFSSIATTLVATTVTVADLSTGSATVGTLGLRAFNIAKNYTRYRINKLLFRAFPANAAIDVDTSVAFAVIDDPSSVQPTSFDQLANFRCSRAALGNRQDSSNLEFEWVPVDRSKWYYVLDDNVSLADARFAAPCTFVAICGTTAGTCTFQVYYDITFEGATSPQG